MSMRMVICTLPLFFGFLSAACGLYGQSGQSSLVHRAASLSDPPQQYKHFCRTARLSSSLTVFTFFHAVVLPLCFAVARQAGYDPAASGKKLSGALSELLPHKK